MVRESYISGVTKLGQQDIYTLFENDTVVTIAVRGEGCGLNENEYYWGQAIITGFSQSGVASEFHTYSFTATGAGKLYFNDGTSA